MKYTHGKGEFSGWDILFPCEIYILHLNLQRTHWKVTDFHSIKIGQLLDFYGIFKVFLGGFWYFLCTDDITKILGCENKRRRYHWFSFHANVKWTVLSLIFWCFLNAGGKIHLTKVMQYHIINEKTSERRRNVSFVFTKTEPEANITIIRALSHSIGITSKQETGGFLNRNTIVQLFYLQTG